MSDTVTLHCEQGDHSWEREKVRGKRPRNCPEHSVVAVSEPRPKKVSSLPAGLEAYVGLTVEDATEEWHRPLIYIANQATSDKRPSDEPIGPLIVRAEEILAKHGGIPRKFTSIPLGAPKAPAEEEFVEIAPRDLEMA